MPRSRELGLAAVVVGSIGGATALLLVGGGYPVVAWLAALWTGAFGSWYAFTSATLVRAIPLMLTGGAVALAFRGRRVEHRRRKGSCWPAPRATAASRSPCRWRRGAAPLAIAGALLAAARCRRGLGRALRPCSARGSACSR